MRTKHIPPRLPAAALLLVLVSFGAVRTAGAQIEAWTTHGPEGGDTLALAIDPLTPATVYAGTAGGVFKSANGGASWRDVSTGLTSPSVRALAIDPRTPGTIYAGTGGGVSKSTDGGESWTAVNGGLTTLGITALAVDPQMPATVHAGTIPGGIFKSTDGGLTWTAANAGLSDFYDLYVNALLIDPVTPSTLYAGTWTGVFKSTDGAASWAPANTGLTYRNVSTLAADPLSPSIVFAGTQGGGIFRSFDGGAIWSPSNTGLTFTNLRVLSLAVDPQNPTLLYTGIWNFGLYRSFDAGTTWHAAGLPSLEVRSLAIDPQATTTLYAGTIATGLFKSTDGAGTWSAANTGMNKRVVQALAIDPLTPTTLYAGISSGLSIQGGGVHKSTDGAESWGTASRLYYRTAANDVFALAIDPLVPTTLYAGTSWNGVYKSTNGGSGWSGITWTPWCDPCSSGAVAIDPGNTSIFYAIIDGGTVYKNTAGIWSRVLTPTWPAAWPATLALDPQISGTVYVGLARGGVYKSTDGGATWTATAVDPTGPAVAALAIDPQLTTTLYMGTAGSGIFKSLDGGSTWSSASIGLTTLDVRALAVDPRTPTTVYTGTLGGGVFKSTNGGESWAPLNNGLTNLFINDVEIDPLTPTTIHAATRAGVFTLRQQSSSSNQPPIADAGSDQIVEATGPDGAAVTLDGSGSSDPDGDPLSYDWSWSGGSATGVRPTMQLPVGTTSVTLVVSDPHAASATDTVQVTVQDTMPPSVAITSPGGGVTVSGTITISADASDAVGVVGVQFFVDGAATGAEDTAAPYEAVWDTSTVPDGSHTLTARARDSAGNVAASSPVTVNVANGSPSPTPGASLVAHWALDEGSGTTAGDSSGNGHTGVLLGGPAWTTGQQGSALAFDGVDDHVEVAHAAALNAYPFSVAAWIKTGSTTGVRGIVNKYVPFSFNGWGLFLNEGNLCAWYLRDSANYVYPGGGCPFAVPGYDDDQWHHVAFVVDAAGGRLYVDGVSQGSIRWTGTPGPPTTTQAVHLARYPGAYGGAEYFPGLLDEVRIYDHALSGEELSALATSTSPAWTASGLESWAVTALAMDPQTPTTMYAGTGGHGGVFKSTDGGRIWSQINNGITDLDIDPRAPTIVSTLAIDPSQPAIVYAGTATRGDPPSGRVYKSTDGGTNWVNVTPSAFAAPVSHVAIDPLTPTTLYLSSSGHWLWKSTNGGATWSLRGSGNLSPNVGSVAIDPQTPATLYVGATDLFKSNDGGDTWTTLRSNSAGALAIDPLTPTTVYVGRGAGEILKTTDGGATWTSTNIGVNTLFIPSLAIDPPTPATLYAATWESGVFKTTDGAGSWRAVNDGLTNLDIRSLAIDPQTPTTVYAGTGAGVFKLQQGGGGSSPSPATPDLMAHWALDEGSGTVASDSSGHGHHGTLINSPTWTAGHSGSALAFDGVDDHVEVAHGNALNAYPLTVAAWIRTSSTTGVRGIVNKYVPYSFNGWGLFLNEGNLCAWYLRDTSNYVYPGGGCPFAVPGYTDDQWHHVAFVVDADGGRLYVDGLIQGSIAWTGTPGPPTTTQAIHLSRYPGAYGGAEYFPGLLDEVRIYDHALSADEISSLAGPAASSTQ